MALTRCLAEVFQDYMGQVLENIPNVGDDVILYVITQEVLDTILYQILICLQEKLLSFN